MDKRSLIFVIALTAALLLINQWFSKQDHVTKVPQQIGQEKILREEEAKTPEENFEIQNEPLSTQEYFVLENDYQQLVFSNLGGALAEINLLLESKENQSSIVKPIEFDRIMEEQHPQNDHFPAFSYYVPDSSSPSKMKKIPEGRLGGYYPLIRRSIIGPRGSVAVKVPPHFYALNILSENPESAEELYRVKRFEKDLIEFESIQPHRKITKTFSFPKNPSEAPYCFDLSIKVEGDSRGLQLTSGIPEVELISGNFTPSIKYRVTRNHKTQVEQLDLPKNTTSLTSIYPNWICNSNGFLGVILDPLTEIGAGFSAMQIAGEMAPTRLSLIDAHYNLYPASKYPGYELRFFLKNTNQTSRFRIYAGPFENAVLQKVDEAYLDPVTGYNPEYTSALSFHGWFTFISEPFAKFLFILMKFFHQITSSWGISIILLTLALRIMLYPLNAWSIKSTAKMQQIAPQVSAIQERYKKDPKRAQMEVMALYREKGVNPLTGCLPILIQLPFLFGMFDLLKSIFDLRGASFIPGWIDNLTAPDVLFSWNYPLIFVGTDFHLLPFILGAVMYLQQRFSSPIPKDKKLLTDQQRQQKFMGNIMVIVFTVMFYHFPSGLNIYWLSSMVLGIVQQWYMTRKKTRKSTNP